MSFSDQPPSPPHFMSMSSANGDVGGAWSHSSMNHDLFEYEHATPFKRLNDSDNNLPNSPTFPTPKIKIDSPNLLENQGTRNIFYKTRMCTKFFADNCKNGKLCTYAHGIDELREPPPNWQDLVRVKDRELNDNQGKMNRMKICKMFYDGEECPYGYKCNFLHERPQISKTNMPRHMESCAITIETTGNISHPKKLKTSKHENDVDRIKRPIYWKTKICMKWETTGQCPFGDHCHFAHGQSDLQVPMYMNSIPTTPRPFSVPLAANTLMNVSIEEAKNEKKIPKWKPSKKIAEIYGDWLDGCVAPHRLFSNIEC